MATTQIHVRNFVLGTVHGSVPPADAADVGGVEVMRLIVLGSLTPATGNAVTLQRIAQILEKARYIPELYDIREPPPLDDSGCAAVIGMHLFRAGALLQRCPLPRILIIGGTDVNEYLLGEEAVSDRRIETIVSTIISAFRLVVFSRTLFEALVEGIRRPEADRCFQRLLQPTPDIESYVRDKTVFIPQAVSLPDRMEDAGFLEALRGAGVGGSAHIFLLPCGLRPVKHPLFVVKAFREMHTRNHRVWLVIVGPQLNQDVSLSLRRLIVGDEDDRPLPWSQEGVAYLGALPRPVLLAGMQRSVAVLNTSRSEGMPNSVLESLALGTPVLARNIRGNASIVHHGENGLLFDTPEECISAAGRLLEAPAWARRLGDAGRAMVERDFRLDSEEEQWATLVRDAIREGRARE